MKKKILIFVFVLILIILIAVITYLVSKPKEAVLQYFRIQNTEQKIGSRDDVNIGTITKVNGTHFFVSFPDGKKKEFVIIRLTKYDNGEKKDIVVGKKVGVIGSYDEDGTYIAKIIRFDTDSTLDFLH